MENPTVTNVMESSSYSQVIFDDIHPSYPPNTQIVCHYIVTAGLQPNPRDWVGICKVRITYIGLIFDQLYPFNEAIDFCSWSLLFKISSTSITRDIIFCSHLAYWAVVCAAPQVGWSSMKDYHTFVWVEPSLDVVGQDSVRKQVLFRGMSIQFLIRKHVNYIYIYLNCKKY